MSAAPLPKVIEPLKLVDQRADLEGSIGLSQFARLADVLQSDGGEVMVNLRFDVDEQRVKYIEGHVNAAIDLLCERCLQPYQQSIDTAFKLGLVFSDEAAKHLPREYDPLLLEEIDLALWEVIEDELILSLPVAALHPQGECEAETVPSVKENIVGEREETERENPFSALAELKKVNAENSD